MSPPARPATEHGRPGPGTATGSMSVARENHTATLLPSGKVLIAGGFHFDGGAPADLVSAELYDPSTGTFTATDSMAWERSYHTATLLPEGTVLVAGGLDDERAELYDSVAGTFAATGSMSVARQYHTATLLPSGKVLIAGGADYGVTAFAPLASAELYE